MNEAFKIVHVHLNLKQHIGNPVGQKCLVILKLINRWHASDKH